MIEIRLFATLREGRGKILMLDAAGIRSAGDVLCRLNIPREDVAILLINGFHAKPEDPVTGGDIIALFPPVGGG